MKTLLVMLVFVGRSWVPQYAVEYPDEASCLKAEKTDIQHGLGGIPLVSQGDTKTVCLPKLLYKEGK